MSGPVIPVKGGNPPAPGALLAAGAGPGALWRLVLRAFGGEGALARAMLRARVDLLLWAPLALGSGIGLYFLWRGEPGGAVLALFAGALALGGAGALLAAEPLRFPAALLALLAAGFLLALLRAHAVAAPVLSFRYYGPVEGRVVALDRSARDMMRITLDRVVLTDVPPGRAPGRVRIALPEDSALPEPGERIRLLAHLQPPSGPTEPGAWDFRRYAWFAGLGAVGYSRAAPERLAAAEERSWALSGYRLRLRFARAMRDRMEGQPGAIAAALMTGDRSGITEATNRMMRASGLYHIISISGLHMGMIAGFVFAALRYGLAAIGNLALIWPVKKIAAVAGLIAATLYLWVAGPQVATERAYLMTSVMLLAVLFDRRALSLRSVALAALLLLALRPEGLLEPGFQMSFAATVGLIVVLGNGNGVGARLPRRLRPVLLLALTSLVAGSVTAPIAAAHFGRVSGYGLLANMLAVPVMGALVMPAGVIAALLAPVGAAGPALWVMAAGTRWMVFVGEWVAGMAGAVRMVPAPPPEALPLMAVGGIVAILGSGGARLAGAGLAAGALAFWGWTAGSGATRPPLLIAEGGQIVGLATPEGRALSKPVAAFVATRWLEADGDSALPGKAVERRGFTGDNSLRRAVWNGREVLHLTGKRAERDWPGLCRDGAILVLNVDLPGRGGAGNRACDLWDVGRLRATGAVSYGWDGKVRVANPRRTERRLW